MDIKLPRVNTKERCRISRTSWPEYIYIYMFKSGLKFGPQKNTKLFGLKFDKKYQKG